MVKIIVAPFYGQRCSVTLEVCHICVFFRLGIYRGPGLASSQRYFRPPSGLEIWETHQQLYSITNLFQLLSSFLSACSTERIIKIDNPQGRLSPNNQGAIPPHNFPLPLPSPFPPFPSFPLFPYPSSSLSSPISSCLEDEATPLKSTRGLGSAVSFPVGSGAKPQPTSILVCSERKKLIWQQLLLYGFLCTEIC